MGDYNRMLLSIDEVRCFIKSRLLLSFSRNRTLSPYTVLQKLIRQPNLRNLEANSKYKLTQNNLLHCDFTAGSPYPFNREGKFLFKASDWKSVPRSFPGSPPEVAIIGRYKLGSLITDDIS